MDSTNNNNSRKMYVQMPIKVKTYDVDYMLIVNNTVYVKWFEDMRIAIVDKFFPLEEMLKENNSPILAETHIKYRHPIALESHPIGHAWISQLDRSRWVASFEIVEGDTVYCDGFQVGYYYNLNRHRPVRFPQSILDLYDSL